MRTTVTNVVTWSESSSDRHVKAGRCHGNSQMVRWKLLCHCERKGAADSALFSQPQSAAPEAKLGGNQTRRPAASGRTEGGQGPRFKRQRLTSWCRAMTQQKKGRAMTQQKTSPCRSETGAVLHLLHYSANLQLLSIIQAAGGRQRAPQSPEHSSWVGGGGG